MTVLVTAATGKTGRRVVERLTAAGLRVRAGSRTGETVFDWEAPDTWAPALKGADLAYVNYFPDLAAPGAIAAMRAFGREAAAAGVRRLVLLSGRGEPEAVFSEGALADAGVPVTVVRGAFFAQNFSEGWLGEGLEQGEIAFPAGDTGEPFVDAEDLADVLVATLTDERHAGRTYEITGPRVVTFAEAAAEISRAAGREIRYIPVSGDEYRAGLEASGLPPAEAAWLTELFGTLLDGHNASTTDGVREVLGREPRDFAAFARREWGGGN
ncbi:NmrA family NAD(P)-binding protein [Streptomyces sp. SID5473]|uniref:NmrA family transcriptional regulator n=1 Tax=Streptomyces tsukubensis (strain DSM 42081 / NBRC 108919 / NRRL 18488 / 9993) TaxID=1114943 RepID=A0A7G3UM32_STRT9|nr:NmrA family NAD(P)-binding protein [Streptomyces sp. SID5473]QKM71384.1 NmrA family transcriptional regulator [Streptomyces tsukubensis NRRL18488]TAI45530.1 NmrA family transcriptional regulator [Streptomyces tsukubensis]